MDDSAVTFPSSASAAERTELLGARYQVKRELGRGGMGTVLLARHVGLDHDVAIKLLAPDVANNQEFIVRLQREAKVVAKLKSEHAVRVIDVDALDVAGPYMVMEYLEGCSLRQELDTRGPLPVTEVVGYMLEALDALAEAHAFGIVHRDLKPSNLFLAQRPDGTRCVKVLDFGISKVDLLCESTADLTSSGALLGTPLYMSPEQLKSPRDVDARADIWSLGVVMYELLAGQAPFSASTVGELCFAIAETKPKPLQVFRDDVPPALERTIQRCLRREPMERFANAEELLSALEAKKRRPRWRTAILAAVVAATALLVWRTQRPRAASTAVDSSASVSTSMEPAAPAVLVADNPLEAPERTGPSLPAAPIPTFESKPTRPSSAASKPGPPRSKPKPSSTSPTADPDLDKRH